MYIWIYYNKMQTKNNILYEHILSINIYMYVYDIKYPIY